MSSLCLAVRRMYQKEYGSFVAAAYISPPNHERREDISGIMHYVRPIGKIVDYDENLGQRFGGLGVFQFFNFDFLGV